MDVSFPTDFERILKRLDDIDPAQYGATRNYVDGAVTRLSPYISRGVLSTQLVLQAVLNKGYKIKAIETFVKELCWRDYFQRVAQVKDIKKAIRQDQPGISNYEIPSRVVSASTGIGGIDAAVQDLYNTGYMHNHCRMYTASLVCNIARSHWYHPARWMYYHLLDGDWASNAGSWQWVAGVNSGKRYYANQENINRFTHTFQTGTYLDTAYEAFDTMEIPATLTDTRNFIFEVVLPESAAIQFDENLPTFIYNYYNLDPMWHREKQGNRILLLEPEFFFNYPVSKKCVEFMVSLSKNIPGIQLYTGSFNSFKNAYKAKEIFYKEHPLNAGYHGIQEDRDWIAKEVPGYYPSFHAYWKKVKKLLYK